MIKPPESLADLATTKFAYKVLVFFGFNYEPDMKPLQEQNRQVIQQGERFIDHMVVNR